MPEARARRGGAPAGTGAPEARQIGRRGGLPRLLLAATLATTLAATLLAPAFPARAQTAPPGAAPTRPLLREGTQTVYERVLTRPGAPLHATAGGPETRTFPAFQPLYVFARQGDWIEIGPSVTAPPEGWVAAATVVDWKQNIVGAFTNSAGRKRQLIFRSEADLQALLNDEDSRALQDRLLAAADAGQGGGDAGVVSVEPAEYVNIRDDLYLMPILDFEEVLNPVNYEDLLLMKVASVPKREAPAPGAADAATAAAAFDVGIVFVMDTTRSMDPYIERTRAVLERTVERLQGTDIADHVNFGLVGFRDDEDQVPGIEYRTRTILDLARREDQSPVIQAIAGTRAATVSTIGFNEDSLAGVEDAVDRIDWDQDGHPISARYVILVTDAGPKDPRDANARSRIGPAELQRDAEGKNIVVITLHLKTPAGGEANHAYAEAQYHRLSRFAGLDFYFPIEGGSEDAFEAVTDRLVTAITDHVRTIRGEAPAAPPDPDDRMAELGRAMQLAWLGAEQGTPPPDVIEGWLSDKATDDATRLAVEPRLLLTKNELATMAEYLDRLTTLAEEGGDPHDFFDQVRSVLSQMATDPNRAVNASADSLGGAIEYLQFLPYRSQLLDMTADRWGQSAMQRREIIDGLHQKLAQYRKWLYDPGVWTALEDDTPDGDRVFAMPFDVLP